MTDITDTQVVESAVDPHDAHDAHGGHVTATGISNEKLGMWVFLGSECLLFGGLISTFLLYKNRSGYGELNERPHDLYDLAFTSISSFVLLMSSLTMVLAVNAVMGGDSKRMRLWLSATCVLGGLFLAGQVYEFTEFVREGLGYTSNVSASAFYTLTGFHGAHVAVGIIMLVSMLGMSFRQRMHAEAIEIVGLYWHFVDVVWIIIFTVVYLIK